MVRTPSCDKSGLRKGTWTPEEDRKLIAYVTRYGCWNWRLLPRFAGLARCGKSCRLRWMNYLRPNVKRGNFTQEEEECIIRMHKKLGNRWSAIAAELPGRTDNEVKNHWHTTLKKRLQHNKADTNEEAKASQSKDSETGASRDSVPNNGVTVFQVTPSDTSQISNGTGPLSSLSSSSEFCSVILDHATATCNNDKLMIEEDFAILDAYIEPYLANISNTPSEIVSGNCNGVFQSPDTTQILGACALSLHQLSSQSLALENDFGSFYSSINSDHTTAAINDKLFIEDDLSFLDAYSEPVNENFWIEPYLGDISLIPNCNGVF